MDLEAVKGLGPATIGKLHAAGIVSVEDLAGLDLRRRVEVPGIQVDALKEYKKRARAELRSAGEPVPVAPRRKSRTTPVPTPRATAPAPVEVELRPTTKGEKPRRGLLARVFRRR